MRVRVELRVAVGALLALQVLTAFGSIALLQRMSPAIARILAENLYSIEACEEMLAAFAQSELDPEAAQRRFAKALARARSNVTEPEEIPLLDQLERSSVRAVRGDPAARERALELVRDLARVNHETTRRADEAARQLGSAGAWAAALLGALSFVFGVLALKRFARRILTPLGELVETAQAFRRDDPHRRTREVHMPAEFEVVARALNELLDRAKSGEPGEQDPGHALEQQALLALLAERPRPTVLLDERGRVRVASTSALGILGGDEGGSAELYASFERVAQGEEVSALEVRPLEGGFLCTLPAREDPPPSEGPPGAS